MEHYSGVASVIAHTAKVKVDRVAFILYVGESIVNYLTTKHLMGPKMIVEVLIIRQVCVVRLDLHGVVNGSRVVAGSCLNIGIDALWIIGQVWRGDRCGNVFCREDMIALVKENTVPAWLIFGMKLS